MKSNLGQLAIFICTWLLFQFAFSLGQSYQNNLDKERFIASIEKRIALDIPKLTLANKQFKTAADPLSVKAYLQDVNLSLADLKSPIQVVSLQGIQLTQASTPQLIVRTLRTVDQEINLELQVLETDKLTTLNWLAPILALIITFINYYLVKPEVAIATVEVKHEPQLAPAQLQINLKNKSINFGQDNEEVLLPNKPFCFYAALVDYCMHTELPNLKHNNDVPDELLQMANKYFYRLIELGHTKRKRPDFGANLDKTLSEIRTALDEVFKNNIEHKEAFYPPKAQGEGSRSKMHNYAIFNRDVHRVEFIGK